MNIQPTDIQERLAPFVATLTKLIIKGAEETARHGRASAVSMTAKIHHDKDQPSVLVIEVSSKTKSPKAPLVDILGRTEVEELGRWDLGEEEGQQRIGQEP